MDCVKYCGSVQQIADSNKPSIRYTWIEGFKPSYRYASIIENSVAGCYPHL